MSIVGAACALAVALVLLAAGVGHARDGAGTRAALAAHRFFLPAVQPRVARLLPPVELGIGAVLVGGVLGGGLLGGSAVAGALAVTALLGAVALLGCFTAYLALVLREARATGADEIPCGCGLGAAPVGRWAVLRAALLAGMALLALGSALASGSGSFVPGADAGAPAWAQVLVVLAAGVSLAVAVAALPAARSVPSTLTTLHATTSGSIR